MRNRLGLTIRRFGRVLTFATILVLAGLIIWWLYSQPWSGLGPVTSTSTTVEDASTGVKTTITTQATPAKSFWDWFALLIVPLVLAVAAYWFNQSERRNELKIASDRIQEETIQNYLDRMTELLLEQNLANASDDSPARDIARARTLTTLRRLDGIRKGIVLQFLYESDLIGKSTVNTLVKLLESTHWEQERKAVIRLGRVDLTEISLVKSMLPGVTLRSANLRSADLKRCTLIGADLSDANLVGADLRSASLVGSWSSSADFSNADLRGAVLKCARLSYAKFKNAKINLDQLATCASLQGATMPDGTIYDGRFNLPGDSSSAKAKEVNTSETAVQEHIGSA